MSLQLYLKIKCAFLFWLNSSSLLSIAIYNFLFISYSCKIYWLIEFIKENYRQKKKLDSLDVLCKGSSTHVYDGLI